MNDESNQTEAKKPYEPPQLTAISLRPEEAVLGHCKIVGQSMPGGVCALTCFDNGS
jgi:hypothetical protein